MTSAQCWSSAISLYHTAIFILALVVLVRVEWHYHRLSQKLAVLQATIDALRRKLAK